MRELRPGLWHWTAPHPQWTPDQPWPHEVSSYAVDDGSRVLLFDPLAVPEGCSTANSPSSSPLRGMSATRGAWSSGSAFPCSPRPATARKT